MASSSQLIQPFYVVHKMPYDVLNRVFDYLSEISESGWSIRVTNRGKMILSANPWFCDINNLLRFKTQVRARPVNLTIQRWDVFHNNQVDIGGGVVVSAIEHPHRIHNQRTIDGNKMLGITFDNRCYTYLDPETEQNMVAYVEIDNFEWANNVPIFRQGCVYDAAGDSKVVSGFSSDDTPDGARIVVNPYGITWNLDDDDDDEGNWALDYAGNPNWEEELEAVEEEEIDFEALPPLQMYM